MISFGSNYNYYLFDYNFSFVNYIVTWIFVLLLSLRFRKTFARKENKESNLSTYLVFFLYLLSYIPTTTLCAFENFSLKFILLVTVFWAFILFLEYVVCAPQKKSTNPSYTEEFTLASGKKNRSAIIILSVVVVCFVLGFSYYYRGFNINLDLNDVYILRYGEIRSLDGILKYIFVWIGILVCAFSVRAFQKKDYLQFAFWVVLMLLYYSIEGNKTILFMIPISIAAVLLKLKDNMWMVPTLFIVLNVCATIEPLIDKVSYFNGYWGLRTLFLPSNLTHMYYEYFSVNGPDYWARSFMRHFGAVSKYDMDFGHLMDIEFFHSNGEGNANTGLFGTAFANWGEWCIVIYPCVMLFVFVLINWFTKHISIKWCYVLLIYYSYTLLNCDPFICLITNGLLVVGFIYRALLFPNRMHCPNSAGNKGKQLNAYQ